MNASTVRFVVLLVTVGTVAPYPGLAQDGFKAPDLARGERIRVTQSDGAVVTGLFWAASAQDLRLTDEVEGGLITIPKPGIELTERSLGPPGSFWTAFGITMVVTSVGLGAGSANGWSPCVPRPRQRFACVLATKSRRAAFDDGAKYGAILGLPFAVLFGFSNRQERWETVSLLGPVADGISITPIIGSRFGLATSIRFGGS